MFFLFFLPISQQRPFCVQQPNENIKTNQINIQNNQNNNVMCNIAILTRCLKFLQY